MDEITEEWTETPRPGGLLGWLDAWWCRQHHRGYGIEYDTEEFGTGGVRRRITRAKCGDCNKPIAPKVAMERGAFGCSECGRPW